ncbi:MAG: hypothetical protein KDI51_13295 [Xanthomonadales bacterium]|nr:hypothetical protein [Xanthomonadales bacterium]MCB1635564.1 hypothetical protein [Xanthomonadales bacterium]
MILRVLTLALTFGGAMLLSSPPLPAQTASFQYDEFGRLTRAEYPRYRVEYQYDANGNLTHRTITSLSSELQFALADVSVTENAGNLTIEVNRSGTTPSDIGVDYRFADLTATNGQDYVGVDGSLSWPGNDPSSRTISIAILADQLPESAEQFTLTLSNPTGGAELGPVTTVTVTILNVDEQIFGNGFED